MLDSGTTSHTWPNDARVFNCKIVKPHKATSKDIPNGTSMLQTHTGHIPITHPAPAASLTKIYLDHTYKPLLSLGQF